MSNLTEEQKKILEQQGIKPSSEKDISYRKDGKPVSMEEINKTLETKYKESQQAKVKIQSAKGALVPNDKNDVSSILNEIKDIIIEIKDKLFKRAGVAPSGKKQLDAKTCRKY
jgi:ribonuclease I